MGELDINISEIEKVLSKFKPTLVTSDHFKKR
jgi:hypothetical protein